MRYDELLGMGVNIKPFYIAKENRSLYTAQPYAYLLKLVDELQDWDREKFGEIDKRTVLSGSEMDIYSWPDKIGVWFKKDEDICKHPEVAGSVFSNMKKKLSDYIDVNVLLQGKTNSQMPKSEDIVKSREEFTNIFYCDAAKALMEHIKTVNRCKKISILLYNRKRDTFGYLYTNGVIDDNKDNDIEKFVRHHYFCNDSLFSEVGTSKITKGFSLISTQVGPLGFLVLEDFSSIEPSTQKELNTNHGDNPVLGDLGLIYGTLIFRTIQRKIHDDANEGIPFSSISNGGGNLVTQINDYIPFGHNSCISVFLDIRGLSCLFNGNRKYEKRALEFIRRFSRIVEEQSRKHYGIITCHFGGGMLITFNQVLREELDMSCFRAICTMYKIRKEFVETLLPLAEELFGKAKSEKINIGMGASAGEAIFTTLGCSTSIVYTGIGNKVGFAKKMENISGRNEVLINHEFSSSEDKIFISDDVHQYCAKRDNGIKLQLINNICVSHSKDLHRFYYLGCENMNSDNCYLLHKDKDNNACQGCIDTAKCPVEYKCKDCIEEE